MGLVLFYLTQNIYPKLSLLGIGLFLVVYPFLIYQSLRFLAANSSWRNLRFRFHGTLGESYKIYMMLPLLTLPTLGPIIPYILFRHRQYLFGNAAYGTTRNEFRATSGQFYSIHILARLMGAVLYGLFFGLIWYLTLGSLRGGAVPGPGAVYTLLFTLIPAYAVLLLGLTPIQQYVYANTVNLYRAESSFGGKIKFVSTLRSWDLIKLRVVNLLAMIFSAGCATPAWSPPSAAAKTSITSSAWSERRCSRRTASWNPPWLARVDLEASIQDSVLQTQKIVFTRTQSGIPQAKEGVEGLEPTLGVPVGDVETAIGQGELALGLGADEPGGLEPHRHLPAKPAEVIVAGVAVNPPLLAAHYCLGVRDDHAEADSRHEANPGIEGVRDVEEYIVEPVGDTELIEDVTVFLGMVEENLLVDQLELVAPAHLRAVPQPYVVIGEPLEVPPHKLGIFHGGVGITLLHHLQIGGLVPGQAKRKLNANGLGKCDP